MMIIMYFYLFVFIFKYNLEIKDRMKDGYMVRQMDRFKLMFFIFSENG